MRICDFNLNDAGVQANQAAILVLTQYNMIGLAKA